ncbi:FAD-dependent oxidoreductase [Bradyrhizobium sp. dw_78]|uniref:flavin-containing monooxygenase n=1 Tax=Bradyrhizobium sp. dw_78 TaxID=2719793 RepID=UPI001BD1C873
MKQAERDFDVIVVGAGFAGLYALHRLRSAGYSVRVLEAGDGIGGTWFWNRYPGARCDIESMQYSYSFSEEIQQEWNWSQLFAPQPEILSYINYVADKLDLRKDIQLNARVASATFDSENARWIVTTAQGDTLLASFCVMATGCLTVPLEPNIEDLDKFEGGLYRTSRWPHEGVDFAGKRVALIGTGSTGIQAAPVIAEVAEHLHVFQRTPNYSLPAGNRPMDPGYLKDWKENYVDRRRAALATRNNTLNNAGKRSGRDASPEEREREFEARWQAGGSSSGIGFMYTFTDMTRDQSVNDHASDFIRRKIAATVEDPVTADLLTPKHYGIGGRRICVDTNYYETFNRSNVTLVDARRDPIKRLTRTGLENVSGTTYPFDVIVLAIGFDGMTGALLQMDITGQAGLKLSEHWKNGPRTYLGLALSGFPNMFLINGPGSPSVLSNMVTSIEQHVDWITACIGHVKASGKNTINVSKTAEADWFDHVNETAAGTLIPNSDSWYLGANVPGKPRFFMVYLGGAAKYKEIIDKAASGGYEEFNLR